MRAVVRGVVVRSAAAVVVAAALTAGGSLAAVADPAPDPATPTALPATDPTAPAPPALTAPASIAVTGAARDGSTLSATTAGLSWGGTPDAVTVQWQRDDVDVAGATGPRLPLTEQWVDHRVRAVVTATAGTSTVAAASADRVVQPGRTSERRLRTALAALLRKLPGRYTLQLQELDGGQRSVDLGAARHREPASVFKLFVAYGVLTRIDAGSLRWTDRTSSGLTVRSCFRAMIEPSDNSCAHELRTRVGTARLNRLLHRHGMTGTTFWYDGHRTKTTTAADVALLLERLARGTLVSAASTKALLVRLETQVWREAIPPGLPTGVRQASKPGCLWTAHGMVQTDSAIVWGSRSRYVLVVMGSDGATTHAITRISRAVYGELEAPVRHPFRYQRQQMRATGALVMTSSVHRGSRVLGRFRAGTRVEVIDSVRTRYLVRIAGRTGWIDNGRLTLRHPVL